jgi:glyoxylase-like metal-dependent hydrolase (beta-lactamase superfamily II)
MIIQNNSLMNSILIEQKIIFFCCFSHKVFKNKYSQETGVSRMPSKFYPINDDVFLIDSGWEKVVGLAATYLVKGEKTCLIDGGTREGSKDMLMSLKALNVNFPDYIVLTHSHYDHTQGVHVIREAARKAGKEIEVFAHENGIERLADQSFNKIFDEKATYYNIPDVNPIKNGDEIDLGGNKLQIIEAPGHIPDHIVILEEKGRILFTGDAIGAQYIGSYPFPTFMPPLFNKHDYFNTLNMVKNTDFQGIALGHYGYYEKEAAKKLVSDTIATSEIWSKILDRTDYRLEDYNELFTDISKETTITKEILRTMDLEVKPFMMRTMMGVINSMRRLVGKHPFAVSDQMFPEFMKWTIKGYRDRTDN